MIGPLKARISQGYRTLEYPRQTPLLPDRFIGLPSINSSQCTEGCNACATACPVDAVVAAPGKTAIDLGKCIFCNKCAMACPEQAIRFTHEHRMAVRERAQLSASGGDGLVQADELKSELRRLFKRSFRLRQVSAGGCNACEADINVLSTIAYDLSRFGIQFVASPRHADGLLITGPIPRNMELALRKTYEAVPSPKVVIAVGACAISGGIFAEHDEVLGGAANVIPVDLFIPGCPPHPLTILDGLLRLLGKAG